MSVYSAVVVPLRLDRGERRRLWTMVGEQRQAFNFGVVATLEVLERDGKTGSRFGVWKTLTKARHSGAVAAEVPLMCQRAGVAAGRDAVKLWQDTIKSNMGKVGFWAARRDLCRTRTTDTEQLAELIDRHGAAPQDLVVVELMDRLRVRIADAKDVAAAVKVTHRKADPVKERRYCDTKLAAASWRCSTHLASGTRKLFRSRKDLERNPQHLPALTYQEGAILGAGVVRLPGGMMLRLMDPGWELPEGTRWSGAVQIVDTTGRVTRTTRAEHRTYALHAQLVLEVADPVKPTSSDQVIGVDAGVAIAVAVSDGREFHMPDETDLDNQIKALQQSRSRCSYGSRQWNRRSDQLRRLYERRSHLRDQADRHIAKAIATTANICAVGAEITNNKGLVASAAGTAEHPGVSVAAKRTLNRLLHSSRFAGVRTAIERACAKVGKLYVPVPAPGTSSMCHRCGGKGIRESQAVFRCPGCGWVGNADFNAAHNVDHRTCTHLSIDWVQKNPAAGAVVVRWSGGRNPSRAPCDASEAISKKYEPNHGHHRI